MHIRDFASRISLRSQALEKNPRKKSYSTKCKHHTHTARALPSKRLPRGEIRPGKKPRMKKERERSLESSWFEVGRKLSSSLSFFLSTFAMAFSAFPRPYRPSRWADSNSLGIRKAGRSLSLFFWIALGLFLQWGTGRFFCIRFLHHSAAKKFSFPLLCSSSYPLYIWEGRLGCRIIG